MADIAVGKQTKLWNKQYVLLLFTEFCFQLASFLISPVIANYVVFLGGSVVLAGILVGEYPFVALIFRPLGNVLFKRYTDRQLLMASAIVFAIGSFFCAALHSITGVAIFRGLMGIALVARSSCMIAFATLLIPPEHLGKGIGWISLMSVLMCSIGTAITQVLGSCYGYDMPMYCSAAVFVVAFLILTKIKDPGCKKRHDRRELKGCSSKQSEECKSNQSSLSSKSSFLRRIVYFPALPIACAAFLMMMIHGMVSSLYLLIYEIRFDIFGGVYFLVQAVSSLILRPTIGTLYDNFGLKRLCIPLCLSLAVSLFINAFNVGLASAIVSGLLFGAGCSLIACLQAESVREADTDKLSLSINTYYIGADLGVCLGPIVGSIVMEALGINIMLVLFAGIACLLAVVLLSYVYWRKRRDERIASKNKGSMFSIDEPALHNSNV